MAREARQSPDEAELLELLLRLEPSAVEVQDTEGDTALHHLAQATELEVLSASC